MMKKNILKLFSFALLLCIIFLLVFILSPRTYDVPKLQKRQSTLYWNLLTGSRIGYTFVPAKGIKRPFPIIYLNGGPGGYVTDNVIKVLSRLSENGYDVYLYDQIGSGQSDRLLNIKEYTPDRHKRDLEEIVKKIGANKVILIGQSWGAILAVLFTADNPLKIQKIVFTCPGPIYPIHKGLSHIKAPDSLKLGNPIFNNRQGNEKANNLRSIAMRIHATLFYKKLVSDKEADNFETYLNYEVNKSAVFDTSKILKADAGAGFYARVMTFNSLLQLHDPRPKVKNLKIPILVLKAQYDNQSWGFTNEYCELFVDHQFIVIPNAGHFISVEQPELYIKAIRNFLNQ